MERRKISVRGMPAVLKVRLAFGFALLATLLAQPTVAFGLSTVVGLIITAVLGLVGFIISWIALTIIKLVNSVLVQVLFCSLTINPAFYIPPGATAFQSAYAPACGLTGVGNMVPSGQVNMIKLFMRILYPLFAVALALTGAYLIFMASSPQHRARAKQMMNKIITAMVLAALSPLIYQLLLVIAGALTDGVLSMIDNSIIPPSVPITQCILNPASAGNPLMLRLACSFSNILPFNLSNALDMMKVMSAIIMLTLTSIFWVFAIMTVMFRYVAVVFLGVLFPLTLALYMFEFTRNIGRRMLKTTLIFILTPFLMAFWLATSLAMLPYVQSSDNFYTGLMLLVMMSIMITVVPLQLSGILTVIGGIITAVGQFVPGIAGTAMVAAGAIMQGKGASALSGAALKFSGSKLLKGGKQLIGAAVFGGKGAAGAMVKGASKSVAGAFSGAAKGLKNAFTGRGRSLGSRALYGSIGRQRYARTGKKAGNVMKVLGKAAVKATVGKAVEKATFGYVKAKDVFKGGAWKGLGTHLKNKGKSIGKKAGRIAAVTGALVLGGALGGPVGLAIAGVGLAFGTKTGRDMIKRGATAAYKGAGKAAGKSWNAMKSVNWKGIGAGIGKGLGAAGIAAGGVGAIGALGALTGPLGLAIAAGAAATALAVKNRQAIGRSLGKAWDATKKGAASAWRGTKSAFRTGWQGIGQSLKKAEWGKIGMGALKGVGAAATLGLSTRAGRSMWKGAVLAAGRAAWDTMKETRLGQSMEKAAFMVKRAGIGGSLKMAMQRMPKAALRAVLGKQEFARYQQRRRAGRKTLPQLAGSLARRGVQKALGLTDQQVKGLERRGKWESMKGVSEGQRDNVSKVIDKNGKGFDKLSSQEKAHLATLAGVSTGDPNWSSQLQARLGGLDDQGKKDLLRDTNNHFDKKADMIDKSNGMGSYERMEDSKLASRSLMDDAKNDPSEAKKMKDEAQEKRGFSRDSAMDDANKERGKNPERITKDEANALAELGIHTRGDLAHVDDKVNIGGKEVSQRDRILASGKIREDRLNQLREGAKEGSTREANRSERWMRDSGMTPDEMRGEKEKDSILKERLTYARGGRQNMKEDFLTAVENEQQM